MSSRSFICSNGVTSATICTPAEAKSEFDIVLAVADKLGCREELYPSWTNVEDAFNEWRRVSQGRIALIGDASGSVDAITGEGLCLSFRQAMLLSECFAAGSLNGYQARHRILARRPALMSWLMLTLEGRDSFRQRVMQAFATQPRTFARMLAMHVGALTPVALAGIGLSLGWGLLTI